MTDELKATLDGLNETTRAEVLMYLAGGKVHTDSGDNGPPPVKPPVQS